MHIAFAATICVAIEFRPNDLALPRLTRLTDDLPKISRLTGPGSRLALKRHVYERPEMSKGTVKWYNSQKG